MKNYNYGSAAPKIERIPHLKNTQQHNKKNKNYLNITILHYMISKLSTDPKINNDQRKMRNKIF